jgi:hypothetical protein
VVESSGWACAACTLPITHSNAIEKMQRTLVTAPRFAGVFTISYRTQVLQITLRRFYRQKVNSLDAEALHKGENLFSSSRNDQSVAPQKRPDGWSVQRFPLN